MNTNLLTRPVAAQAMALLTISGLRLVMSQTEIRALETASEIDTREAAPFSVGWISHAQQRWPVYCLSPELTLLVVVPGERRACVLLDDGSGYLGILFDEVSIVKPVALGQQHELPKAMRMPDTPVLGLIALGEDGIACVTSAQRLVAHTKQLVKV